MKRETEIAGEIVNILRKRHSCFVVNIAGNAFQMIGLPDILIVHSGLFIFVECKIEDKPLKGVQESVRKQLAKQNVEVHILRFIEPKFWILDDLFQIRFKTLSEGVKGLLELLIHLEKTKGGSACVQMDSKTTQYNPED